MSISWRSILTFANSMDQHGLPAELTKEPTSNRQTELMKKARESASFNPRQLSYVIYDGSVF